jgi:hypothetical protein
MHAHTHFAQINTTQYFQYMPAKEGGKKQFVNAGCALCAGGLERAVFVALL